MKKNIAIFLLVLAASVVIAQADVPVSQSNEISNIGKPSYSYKDPFLAGVLSWVMPGAGQIYAQSYTKGSVFIFANLVDKTSMVMLLLYLNNNYKGVATGITWKDLRTGDKALIISYLALSTTLKLYNSIDAIYTAERYNRSRHNLKLGLYFDPNRVETAQSSTGFQLTWQERL